MSSYRAVVADDDAEMRAALSLALGSDPRFEAVAEVADGHDLYAVVRRTTADVVLLDVRMPGGGTAAVRAVRDAGDATVVAVSSETDPATVAELIRAGAQGYLAKDRLGTSLPDLVSRCLAGEVIIATPTAGAVLRRLGLPVQRRVRASQARPAAARD